MATSDDLSMRSSPSPLLRFLLCLALASAAILGTAPRAARADDEAATQKAKEYFQRAQRLYKNGRYREASDYFLKAYELKRVEFVLFDLARALQQDGDVDEAITRYQEYLRDYPDGKKADEARQRLRDLGGEIPAPLPPASTAVAPPPPVQPPPPPPQVVVVMPLPPTQPVAVAPPALPPKPPVVAPEALNPTPAPPARHPVVGEESSSAGWWLFGTATVVAAVVGGAFGYYEATRPAIPPQQPGSILGNQVASFH